MLKLTLVMLLILVAACGKAPSMPDADKKVSVSPLNGKTNEEILTLKYNNQLDLLCEIRVQKGSQVDLTKDPTDKFIWNIPGELSLLRVLNYKIDNKETIVVVRMGGPFEFKESLTHINERKQEFYMQHTPVMGIRFRRASKTILTNGSVHQRDSYEEHELYENIPSRLYTMTTIDRDDEPVTEDVRCTLMTKINPAYTDQWVRVK